MSDDYIRLIPTQVTWQPTRAAAVAATSYVTSLFSGPNGSADAVGHEFYDQVRFIDSGVNTSEAKCPACTCSVDLDWVFEMLDERANDLAQLDVVTPCCGALTSLNDLDYDWAMGFARFEIGVLNGARNDYALQDDELDHVRSRLGHAVRQVLAHY